MKYALFILISLAPIQSADDMADVPPGEEHAEEQCRANGVTDAAGMQECVEFIFETQEE